MDVFIIIQRLFLCINNCLIIIHEIPTNKNSKAPAAAGKIHSDFEKGFIRAETVSYSEFIENNGWLNSKTNGKMRLEGKDYIVKDGDVLNFRFNT